MTPRAHARAADGEALCRVAHRRLLPLELAATPGGVTCGRCRRILATRRPARAPGPGPFLAFVTAPLVALWRRWRAGRRILAAPGQGSAGRLRGPGSSSSDPGR